MTDDAGIDALVEGELARARAGADTDRCSVV